MVKSRLEIITDKKLIAKYDKEFNYKFYIPKHEMSSLDVNAISNHVFTDAEDDIGMQRTPLLISVNDDDPFKTSLTSPFRIHGRPLDGKHRYFDSVKRNRRWKVEYAVFRSFDQFIRLRQIVSERKETDVFGTDIRSKQVTDDIVSMAEYLWKVKGILPKTSICSMIVSIIGNGKPYSNATVRRYCPSEYKNEARSFSVSQRSDRIKPISKKDKIIREKDIEINNLHNRISQLELVSKPEEEIHKNNKALEIDKKNLGLEKIRLIDELSKMLCNKCRKPVTIHERSDAMKESNIHGYKINQLCEI